MTYALFYYFHALCLRGVNDEKMLTRGGQGDTSGEYMKQALILLGLAGLLLRAGAADCTTELKATEAWIPFSYFGELGITVLPSDKGAVFSREPKPPHAWALCDGLEEERVTPGQGGYRFFHDYSYRLSDDGSRLLRHEYSLRAPQDTADLPWNGNVRSSFSSFKTTQPGTFVIDGEALRFEQFPGGGIRAMYRSKRGETAEQLVYEAPRDLGHVVFIGDSITHGVGAPSYRWALHKILVDNDVKYREIGVEEGNRLPELGVKPGAVYRGVVFRNLHCAMTSERAYEISGRKHTSQRLGATDLPDWLGLDAAYRGERRLSAAPDTAFILIGTNDMLGDYDGCFEKPENAALLRKALLDDEQGDMSRIVAALRQANPQVRVVVLAVPTWEYSELNQKAESFAALAEYNQALRAWAERKGVIFADVNRVLTDAAETQLPGRGARGLFYEEEGMHLHPSPQGDLLVAGVVAQALGIPGRSLGWVSRPSAISHKHKRLNANEEAQISTEPCRRLYVKAQNAPTTKNRSQGLVMSLCDGEHSGALTLSGCGITWGDGRLLYPAAPGKREIELRVAWVPGDAANGVAEGYYVWLGRMLIGEALPSLGAGACGAKLQNTSGTKQSLSYFCEG